MIIGEGTNEIQRFVIARGLLARSRAGTVVAQPACSSAVGGATKVLGGQERYCRPLAATGASIRGTT